MHWFEKLASFYSEEDVPLFHAFINTDIELHISKAGRFVAAKPGRERITAPVTERSICRTSGVEPHPLFDKLCYLTPECGDDHKYCAYMKQLDSWADSVFSTRELIAVRNYLCKRTLIDDALGEAVLLYNERQAVRFVVDGVKLWEDKALQNSYIDYVRSNAAVVDICCILGECTAITCLHQKHITNTKSSAKLISFGEREHIADERTGCSCFSYPIGMECSFKTHTVLRRLISQVGVFVGYKVFVAWDSAGNKVQLPFFTAENPRLPQGDVTIMAFDEISKGRLFVSFHRHITAQEYAVCMGTWKNAVDIGMIHIAQQAFGRTNNGFCAVGVVENTVQRMVSCLLDRRKQPDDIISTLLRRGCKASADRLRYYNHLIERGGSYENTGGQDRFYDADLC